MKPNFHQVREHQKRFLSQAKSRNIDLQVVINDVAIVVSPGVFPPATDTRLLADFVETGKGERVVDVTTGSGVIAVLAGLKGASGYAIDINPLAVKNARKNIQRVGVDFKVVKSDLFANVPDEKFDVIYANGPFFEGKIEDPMDFACYGAREFVKGLLKATKTRLKPKGKLLMVMSEWADVKHLAREVDKLGLKKKIIAERKSDDGKRKYLLYEIRLGKNMKSQF